MSDRDYYIEGIAVMTVARMIVSTSQALYDSQLEDVACRARTFGTTVVDMALEVPDSIHLIYIAAQGSQSCLISQLPFAASTSISNKPATASSTNRVLSTQIVSKVTIELKQEAKLHVARNDYNRPCEKI